MKDIIISGKTLTGISKLYFNTDDGKQVCFIEESELFPSYSYTDPRLFTFNNNKITGLSAEGERLYDNGELTEIIIPESYSITGQSYETRQFENAISIYQYLNSNPNYPIEINADGSVYTLNSINDLWSYYSTFDSASILSANVINYQCSYGNSHSVDEIHTYAFRNRTNLNNIGMLDNIKTIGSYAFDGCNGLTDMVIGNGVETIQEYAFQNCINIKNLTMGVSVTNVGNYVFNGCSGLTHIITSDINKWAQIDFTANGNSNPLTLSQKPILCHSDDLINPITNIVFNSTVTKIGNHAFSSYDKLESVVIPDSVIEIGSSCFSNCANLQTFNIPNTVQ